jgi:hypothetical protein
MVSELLRLRPFVFIEAQLILTEEAAKRLVALKRCTSAKQKGKQSGRVSNLNNRS